MNKPIPYTSDERVKEMLELIHNLIRFLSIDYNYSIPELERLEVLIKAEYESQKKRY